MLHNKHIYVIVVPHVCCSKNPTTCTCFFPLVCCTSGPMSSLRHGIQVHSVTMGSYKYGNLVDNFSHESDVTSIQDPFTSRPYQTLFYFYYCVPCKIRRGIFFQIHVEYSPSSLLLVSALAVYATAFRPMFPWL